jgi:hypothetical protein
VTAGGRSIDRTTAAAVHVDAVGPDPAPGDVAMTSPTGDTPAADRSVRGAVYRHFVGTGEAPSARVLGEMLDRDEDSVRQSLERLASARLLALAPQTREVWMAHPFSAVATPYPVETGDRRYWANCAWDALAIPALLDVDARISTHCPDCGLPVDASVEHGRLEAPTEAVVHFFVRPARFWDDIGFT